MWRKPPYAGVPTAKWLASSLPLEPHPFNVTNYKIKGHMPK